MKKEDLFYIVIAIGWVLYGFYKKNEKAKIAQQKLEQEETETPEIVQTETSSGNSLLDMLLQGIDPQENYTKKQEPLYTEPILDSIPREEAPPQLFKKKPLLDGDNTEKQILKDRFKQNLHVELEHQQTFNLREAMIHTIILNRPSY